MSVFNLNTQPPIESFYVRVLGHYFAVKGVVHPPKRVVSVLAWAHSYGRYLRSRSIYQTYSLLKEHLPEAIHFDDNAGQVLPAIPIEEVEEVIAPIRRERIKVCDELTRKAKELIDLIDPTCDLGIGLTGSLLLGLQDDSSDIDLVIFSTSGSESLLCILDELRRKEVVSTGRGSIAEDVVLRRGDSAVPTAIWIRLESRKRLIGEYRGTHFTVKVVPLPDEYWEPYGTRRWRSMGRCVLLSEVTDDRFAITTPNAYGVRTIEVIRGPENASEVVRVESMRSRFSEAAYARETVLVSGRLEMDLLNDTYRVFLGFHPSDALIPVDLLGDDAQEFLRAATSDCS
ncbi:MAG: hypothetical protein NZ988_00595 [Thaumarchaeota archaeon]|nr:hypothetical protein [Candidatus Calditenuaceae archaeon]MDW8186534.1 hypothetical protein [Nitrososphaerota archaeon]